MRNKILTLTLIFLLCLSNIVLATHIELEPLEAGQNYFLMKVGEVKTITAKGIGWDVDKRISVPNVRIEQITWYFNKKCLQKVESSNQSITLKAVKPVASKLTIKGKIQGKEVVKCIGVVITR